MPRPSLKEERRAEILAAYGRCIAQHGVEGTTLEMTADEAGLARALIRHNVGNKDDLLDAFTEQYLARSSSEVADLLKLLPKSDRVSTMIQWMFDPRYMDRETISASNALFTAANNDAKLARRLREWNADFAGAIERELQQAYPDAGDKVEAVAAGIVAIYFNFETMAPLGGESQLRESSESAARLLVSTLE